MKRNKWVKEKYKCTAGEERTYFFAFSLYANTFGIVFVFCMNFHPNSHVLYNLSAKSASF